MAGNLGRQPRVGGGGAAARVRVVIVGLSPDVGARPCTRGHGARPSSARPRASARDCCSGNRRDCSGSPPRLVITRPTGGPRSARWPPPYLCDLPRSDLGETRCSRVTAPMTSPTWRTSPTSPRLYPTGGAISSPPSVRQTAQPRGAALSDFPLDNGGSLQVIRIAERCLRCPPTLSIDPKTAPLDRQAGPDRRPGLRLTRRQPAGSYTNPLCLLPQLRDSSG